MNYLDVKDLHENKSLTYKEIALHFNCSLGKIRRIAKRHNIFAIRGKSKYRKIIIQKTKMPLSLSETNFHLPKEKSRIEMEIILGQLVQEKNLKYFTPLSLATWYKNNGVNNGENVGFLVNIDVNVVKRYFYNILKMPCFIGKQNNEVTLTKNSTKKFLALIEPYLEPFYNPVETLKAEKSVSKDETHSHNIAELSENERWYSPPLYENIRACDQAIGRKCLMVDELIV